MYASRTVWMCAYVWVTVRGCPQADKGDVGCPCNQPPLNGPLLSDHSVTKSIIPTTALQMETRSEHNDKPTKARAG